MKIGDLVRFCHDALDERALGVIVQVGVVHPGHWDKGLQAVKVLFPGSNTPYVCKAKDFEVISEAR